VVYGAGPEVEKGGHRVILEETPGKVISTKERTRNWDKGEALILAIVCWFNAGISLARRRT
jgi:hypothetical protein